MIGQPMLSIDEYRKNYAIPIKKFYQNVIGREPEKLEWQIIGDVFNQIYKPIVNSALLCHDAISALSYCDEKGMTQSICSLMEHQELLESVSVKLINSYFNMIDGRRNPLLKTGKNDQLAMHLQRLNISPHHCVVIGDAADDALSAFNLGASAILYTGGTHCAENLAITGAYVVDSLMDAVVLANNINEENKISY